MALANAGLVLGVVGTVTGTIGATVGALAYLRDRAKLRVSWSLALDPLRLVVLVVNEGHRPRRLRMQARRRKCLGLQILMSGGR